MKQIRSLIRQDFTTAIRDNIVIYLMIAPLIFALGMRAFIPTVGEFKLQFAVEESVPSEVISRLHSFGDVEIFKGEGRVIQRVERIDSVPGVIYKDNQVRLVFEGNEDAGIIEIYTTILEKVMDPREVAQFTHRSLEREKSILYELMTIMVIVMATLLGGLVSGFNIVDEKDTKAIRSIAVSPLRLWQFIAARGLLGFVVSLVGGIGASLIMVGTSIDYGKLILALVVSVGITTMATMIMGLFANNQITAIAVVKVLLPVFLTIPLVSIFVREGLQFLFYIFPNYWQFQIFRAIFMNESVPFGFTGSLFLTLALSVVMIVILAKLMKKNLRLR